jgi:hypothetical protein
MTSGPMPPASRTAQQQQDAQLAAAEKAFPGWDFIELLSGWLAVPSDTPVIQAVDLDGIVGKLRAREDQHP